MDTKQTPDDVLNTIFGNAHTALVVERDRLRAALQSIVDQEQHDGQPETHMHDMADIARAALAKARGGA